MVLLLGFVIYPYCYIFTKHDYVIERVIKWLEATEKYIVSFLKNTYGNNYIQPSQFIWGFLKNQSKFNTERKKTDLVSILKEREL